MDKKINKYLNEKNSIFFILLLTVIILLSPIVLRSLEGNTTLTGDKAYYNARIAETIADKGIQDYDKLSYSGRPYTLNPYHLILSWLSFITDIEKSSQILVFLCGIISVLLFFYILKQIKVNILQRSLMLFVLILSPAFIYTFSVSNKYAVSIPLLLAGIYFLTCQKSKISEHAQEHRVFLTRKKLFFSAVFLAIAAFLSLFNIVIALIFLLGEFLKKRDKRILFIMSTILIIFLTYNVPFYYSNGLPEKIRFISINLFQQIISGLGSIIGFSIFALILTVIGLSVTWKRKKELVGVYFIMVFLIITSFYSIYSNIYLNFFISIFAGAAFYSIIKRKWEIRLIMDLTILALVCGLSFSSTSYINRLVSMQPDNNMPKSLEWLRDYSNPEEVVLSHYSKGAFIEYWAQRPVVMDSLFEYSIDPNKRYDDSMIIFSSRSLKETQRLLEKYNVKYIWIDNEMKTGLVWKEEKQGLLFLLRNKETFRNIYNENNIEIWEVITQE